MRQTPPRQQLMAHFLTFCAINIGHGTRDAMLRFDGEFICFLRH
ncbi:MAG: hypothetical protein ACK5YB_08190 [Burkholderiales bacterium]|jgi:hypothetical protein